ncbi:MAG: polysaccharide deacetylase family protein [Clostridia bacterium]|nr:polysaccharide deacetylase family protein [Clostridia bacterium]
MFRKGLALLTSFLFILIGILAYPVSARETIGVYSKASTGEKVIAFTFDDGPHPYYTDQILEVLEHENVHATFFEIGVNIAAYPDVTRRVVAAGHEIGNHSYTHPIGRAKETSIWEEEIRKTDKLLAELGIQSPSLFRPPQGKCPVGLSSLLETTDKIAILWNVDTRDWEHRTTDEIIREVEENVRGGDIVLFHDYVSAESTTIPAIKKLIPALKERGYQFVTVSELLDTYVFKNH